MAARFTAILTFALVCLVHPTPAAAQSSVDLYLTVISNGVGPDDVAVAYDRAPTEAVIRDDFAVFARELGSPPPRVKIMREEGITSAKAELNGLTNWRTGMVNLDAVVRSFRRHGHFRVLCVFTAPFRPALLGSIVRPPVRIEGRANGPMVSYEVWVDQSRGVPQQMPSVLARNQPARGGPLWWVAAAVLFCGALVGLAVYFRRRSQPAGEG